MGRTLRWWAVVLVAGGLFASGCTKGSVVEPEAPSAASVELVEGSDVARITLSAQAVQRLDIQTVPVVRMSGAKHGGGSRTAIPYAAVLYDPTGNAWTYTSPEPRVFVRSPITIDRIAGTRAILSAGPPLGTAVVTVGAAELLGTEYEVGEE